MSLGGCFNLTNSQILKVSLIILGFVWSSISNSHFKQYYTHFYSHVVQKTTNNDSQTTLPNTSLVTPILCNLGPQEPNCLIITFFWPIAVF